MLANSNDKGVAYIVQRMMHHYKVGVTSGQVYDFLLTHPHYPDLISISDAFDAWKIDHATLKIKPERLIEVETPFIAKMKNFSSPIALVEKVDDKYVYYQSSEKRPEKVIFQKFIELWDGIVTAIEPNDKSGEKDFETLLKKEKIKKLKIFTIFSLTALILFLLLYSLFLTIEKNLIFTLLTQLILSLAGLFICILLYTFERNTAPAFVKHICKSGATFDCNNILHSKANKVFGLLSWAEVGLIYFLGFFLSLILNGNNINVLSTLSIFNLVALPYTFFSVFYQAVIAKKWCLLCSTIQIIIWLQLIFFFFGGFVRFQTLNWDTFKTLFYAFSLPILCLLVIDSYFKDNSKLREYKKEVKRFKQHPEIFRNMLHSNRRIDANEAGDFIIGDQNAPITITLATNLYCSPCAAAHSISEEILEQHKDVKLQYVFVFPEDDEIKKNTVEYFGAIYEQLGATQAQKALTFWFKNKDVNNLKKSFPIKNSSYNSDTFINTHIEASELLKISYTPTIFINSYLLPEIYPVEELTYWIPYLRQYLN